MPLNKFVEIPENGWELLEGPGYVADMDLSTDIGVSIYNGRQQTALVGRFLSIAGSSAITAFQAMDLESYRIMPDSNGLEIWAGGGEPMTDEIVGKHHGLFIKDYNVINERFRLIVMETLAGRQARGASLQTDWLDERGKIEFSIDTAIGIVLT